MKESKDMITWVYQPGLPQVETSNSPNDCMPVNSGKTTVAQIMQAKDLLVNGNPGRTNILTDYFSSHE